MLSYFCFVMLSYFCFVMLSYFCFVMLSLSKHSWPEHIAGVARSWFDGLTMTRGAHHDKGCSP